MSHPVLRARREQRAVLVERARRWAGRLPDDLEVAWVVVVGSVARGDFNKWSDLDVLVIAEHLPAGGHERLATLHAGAPPGLQPIGWTPQEFHARSTRRDPIARDAIHAGVTVRGTRPPS